MWDVGHKFTDEKLMNIHSGNMDLLLIFVHFARKDFVAPSGRALKWNVNKNYNVITFWGKQKRCLFSKRVFVFALFCNRWEYGGVEIENKKYCQLNRLYGYWILRLHGTFCKGRRENWKMRSEIGTIKFCCEYYSYILQKSSIRVS